jgi:hypothetical protein
MTVPGESTPRDPCHGDSEGDEAWQLFEVSHEPFTKWRHENLSYESNRSGPPDRGIQVTRLFHRLWFLSLTAFGPAGTRRFPGCPSLICLLVLPRVRRQPQRLVFIGWHVCSTRPSDDVALRYAFTCIRC